MTGPGERPRAGGTGRGSTTVPTGVTTPPKVLTSVDPCTGTPVGSVPAAGPAEVAAAVAAARAAAPGWAALPVRDRVRALSAVGRLLARRIDELAEVIAAETGKPTAEAVTAELVVSVELAAFYRRVAPRVLAPRRVGTGLLVHKRAEVRRDPRGVVGVISPWNYPFALAFGPVLTALVAGNAVVLKPSELTPLTGLAVGRLFTDAGLPEGLVGVVPGDGATGEALVGSGLDLVVFTGSVATGRRVARTAGDALTPVVLELGGKDPMVVLDDADIERAAAGAVWGAFFNAGQTCMAVERVYVHRAVADRFVDAVVDRTRRLRQGPRGPDVGAMASLRQLRIVEAQVEDARARGATVRCGGRRRPGPGWFYEPTVLTGVDHTMAVMVEETFGPVLPVMVVDDDDEALALANDTAYGLNASVWTGDRRRAERFVRGLAAGTVCVNDCIASYAAVALPFGGVKGSGYGRTHGVEGLREMTVTRSVFVDRAGLPREPVWYPLPRWLDPAARAVIALRTRSPAALGRRGRPRPGR